MSNLPEATGAWASTRPRAFALPLIVVLATMLAVGILGLSDSLGWWLVTPVLAVTLVLILMRAPVVLFWLVPVSMCYYIHLPLVHYEALVLLLAALLVVEALPRFDLRHFTLEPIEWRYILFLLAGLPGVFLAASLWSYLGAMKVYAVGLLAFETSRRGARHFGRQAMLWGPLAFVAITLVLLFARVSRSGVPGFRGTALRTYITLLSWGSSNFVAAVFVLCLPAMVLAIRLSPQRSRRRWIATGILIASLYTPLLTASRGGFLISLAYLLSLATRVRRSLRAIVVLTLALIAIGGVLVQTQYGRGMVRRFTNPRDFDSVVTRQLIWQAAWERGIAHLPFGVGAGQGPLTRDKLSVIDPHNFLLTLLGELGPPGLALWLWLIFTLWGAGGRLGAQMATRPVGQALRATVVLAFFNMLFEPTFGSTLYHLLFWWLIGIFYGLQTPPDGHGDQTRGPSLQI